MRHIWWAEHTRTTASIYCSTCSTTGSLDLDVGRLCAAAVLIAAVLLAAILLLQKLWGGEDAR